MEAKEEVISRPARYSSDVLLGNWFNDRELHQPGRTPSGSPDFQTMYQTHFNPVATPSGTEELDYHEESTFQPRQLLQRKRAEWAVESRGPCETTSEYRQRFSRGLPSGLERQPLTEEYLSEMTERILREKEALARNERNRYGPRDFQPAALPSSPRTFVFQGQRMRFTPTGHLVPDTPAARLTPAEINAFLDNQETTTETPQGKDT